MRLRTESACDARMIGTRAPRTMPAASALARKVRFLASILPASRSGTTRIALSPRPGIHAFDPCRLRVDRVVERERPIENTAGDLLAVGHLAERGRVYGRWNLRGHGLDRRKDGYSRWVTGADRVIQINRVLNDVAFDFEIGKYVDRGVGYEKGLGISRDVHDKNMTDAPCGPKAGARCGNRPHQLIGVQTALHQQFALRLVNEFNRFGGRCLAVRSIHQLVFTDVEFAIACDGGDLACRSHEDWNDDSDLGGLNQTTE